MTLCLVVSPTWRPKSTLAARAAHLKHGQNVEHRVRLATTRQHRLQQAAKLLTAARRSPAPLHAAARSSREVCVYWGRASDVTNTRPVPPPLTSSKSAEEEPRRAETMALFHIARYSGLEGAGLGDTEAEAGDRARVLLERLQNRARERQQREPELESTGTAVEEVGRRRRRPRRRRGVNGSVAQSPERSRVKRQKANDDDVDAGRP